MRDNNFAEVLESFLIPAEEGLISDFISKIIARRKAAAELKKQKSSTPGYSEYYSFCDEIYKKIPSEIISKEKALRKKEYNVLKAISNSAARSTNISGTVSIIEQESYDLESFLSCDDHSIFEKFLLPILVFDGYEYMEKKYPNAEEMDSNEYYKKLDNEFVNPAYQLIKKTISAINNKNFACFKNPEDDWDKYEGWFSVDMKPSEEFMKVAREHGYVTYDTFKKR